MAQRLIWSKSAVRDKRDILSYWIKRNESKNYSRKLNKLFDETAALVTAHPGIGNRTDFKDTRLKVVRDYWMVYRVVDETVQILRIWDTRRDPQRFKSLLRQINPK
ncbi:MAG: type II toxin-antitoxin system RelE/ParE family toxin [Cyclobacteriaceae bacterium]